MDARKAASKLENALCRQHVMVEDAALPAYDILIYCLKTTDSALLAEDLHIAANSSDYDTERNLHECLHF